MNINDMLGNEPVMQDRSPEGQIFAIEAEMKNLMEEYDVAARSGDQQRADAINNQIEKLQDIMIEIQNEMSNEGRGDIYNLSTPNIYNSRLRQSLESGDPDEIRKNQEDIKRSALQDIQSIEMSGMMEEYPNDSAKKIEELKRYSMNMGGEASSQHMMPDGTPMPGSNHEEYEAMMMQQRQMMASGGTPFPDLTGDGQITQADILKGRGVYAGGGAPFDISVRNSENEKFAFQVLRDMQKNPNLPNELTAEQKQMFEHGLIMGGEQGIFMDTVKRMKSQGMNYQPSPNMANMYTAHSELLAKDRAAQDYKNGGEAIDDELEGMEMTEEQAMAEVGVAEKEMQMIQQLVAVVQQLIAEGLGEKDIVAFLKEQGLDDEDIDSLMQMVLQAQSGQAPEGIDQQLQGMM